MDEVGGEVARRGGVMGSVWKEGVCPCRLPLLPWSGQLFVWPSRSLVQTLDHAPLHPNSWNFTEATHHICFGIAYWRIQTGSLEVIRLEIKISCWFSGCVPFAQASSQSPPVASHFLSTKCSRLNWATGNNKKNHRVFIGADCVGKDHFQIKISVGFRSLVGPYEFICMFVCTKSSSRRKQWVCRCVSLLESVPL